MPKQINFNSEVKNMLTEIMELTYSINNQTPYAVFLRFSGHVNQIEIEISKSKEEFGLKISDVGQAYVVNFDGEANVKGVKNILDTLREFYKEVSGPRVTFNKVNTVDTMQEPSTDF